MCKILAKKVKYIWHYGQTNLTNLATIKSIWPIFLCVSGCTSNKLFISTVIKTTLVTEKGLFLCVRCQSHLNYWVFHNKKWQVDNPDIAHRAVNQAHRHRHRQTTIDHLTVTVGQIRVDCSLRDNRVIRQFVLVLSYRLKVSLSHWLCLFIVKVEKRRKRCALDKKNKKRRKR